MSETEAPAASFLKSGASASAPAEDGSDLSLCLGGGGRGKRGPGGLPSRLNSFLFWASYLTCSDELHPSDLFFSGGHLFPCGIQSSCLHTSTLFITISQKIVIVFWENYLFDLFYNNRCVWSRVLKINLFNF